jgi:putative membrane protein
MQQTEQPAPPAAQDGGADRRTRLAADRTVLAAERTYAAWVRRLGAHRARGAGRRGRGEGDAGRVLPEWAVLATGAALALFAAFCFAAAVWRELWPGAPPPRPDVRRLPPAALLALNGFLALVCLGALVGIWLGRTGGGG